jgi:tight adherence protein B
MVILLVTFVIVFGLVAGGYMITTARQSRRSWRARLGGQDWAERREPEIAVKPEVGVMRAPRASGVARINSLLLRHHSKLTTRLQEMIERAGVRVTPATVILACCFCALLFNLLLSDTPVFIQAPMTLLATSVPIAFLRYCRLRRDRKYEEVFPEAVEVIARALRAGHSFTTAIAIAADEVIEPVSSELKLLYDAQNYGRPMDEALRIFADRAPVLDARFFATAVLTQRETGGNLSEILDNLVAVIRDRFAVRRQVRAATAQGRLSGWILAAAPPVLALLLLIVNPDHMRSFVTDPLGMQMLIAAAILQISGMLLISRIVRVEY